MRPFSRPVVLCSLLGLCATVLPVFIAVAAAKRRSFLLAEEARLWERAWEDQWLQGRAERAERLAAAAAAAAAVEAEAEAEKQAAAAAAAKRHVKSRRVPKVTFPSRGVPLPRPIAPPNHRVARRLPNGAQSQEHAAPHAIVAIACDPWDYAPRGPGGTWLFTEAGRRVTSCETIENGDTIYAQEVGPEETTPEFGTFTGRRLSFEHFVWPQPFFGHKHRVRWIQAPPPMILHRIAGEDNSQLTYKPRRMDIEVLSESPRVFYVHQLISRGEARAHRRWHGGGGSEGGEGGEGSRPQRRKRRRGARRGGGVV